VKVARATGRSSSDRGILAFGKEREVDAVAVLGRGHAHQFEEAAEADGDLAAEGIGMRQEAAGIGMERDHARLGEVREPGLAVVRVWREERPGQRAAARFVVAAGEGPGHLRGAGRAGHGEPRAGRCGEDRAAAEEGERSATGEGHERTPYDAISHYIVRYRIICKLDDTSVRIIGVEAGGKGVDDRMEHCASLTGGRPGVLHGNRTYLLQDPDGQILEGFSISAGLDYPGIGPEHAWLHDIGRAEYVAITDAEALAAFKLCCELEGIIPALEPSHALAHVMKIAPALPSDHLIVMNMCGRGDKDIFTVARALGVDMKA
jgi:hypothetical protein